MPDSDTIRSQLVEADRWRSLTAVVAAAIGTAAVLVAFDQLPEIVNGWEPIVGGHVTRETAYDQFNAIWLAVRAVMGLYISFVFFVIAGQLLGHWRRYVVEGGEP
ncbi:hypothetical protein [Halapricum hydrolyticum]|uniref:Uncharacterized protein n=1 Tax=Halapricum hydrolyticum TaxID=2979991 RepID=A0AAE3LHV9_9EURY|nr:hypothetical protein [Halapricum hydrolyticum]MCU4718278.1 hypothetical protein [Halapricum hydrolyticum]MCU4727274.1 hypothetical protein [Halapricum hydrolyticum]